MRIRRIFGVMLLTLAIALMTYLIPNILRDFQDWRVALRENDRSAAELYETNLELEAVGSVIALGMAGGGFLLFFPKRVVGSEPSD